MGFSRQEYCSGLPFPSPGDLPDPGIKPESPAAPTLAGGFFYHWATWPSQLANTDNWTNAASPNVLLVSNLVTIFLTVENKIDSSDLQYSVLFLATLSVMRDLTSLTRDQTSPWFLTTVLPGKGQYWFTNEIFLWLRHNGKYRNFFFFKQIWCSSFLFFFLIWWISLQDFRRQVLHSRLALGQVKFTPLNSENPGIHSQNWRKCWTLKN